MRKEYPSDISREQFEEIRAILEQCRKKTRPRKVDLYDVFCAVLYVLKTGCQWRALPSDFPKWQNVYVYFRFWTKRVKGTQSILEATLKKNGLKVPYPSWAQGSHPVLHSRRTKRKKHPL
jgi:transposase